MLMIVNDNDNERSQLNQLIISYNELISILFKWSSKLNYFYICECFPALLSCKRNTVNTHNKLNYHHNTFKQPVCERHSLSQVQV